MSSQRHPAVSATYPFRLRSDSRSGITGASPIDDVSRGTVLSLTKTSIHDGTYGYLSPKSDSM